MLQDLLEQNKEFIEKQFNDLAHSEFDQVEYDDAPDETDFPLGIEPEEEENNLGPTQVTQEAALVVQEAAQATQVTQEAALVVQEAAQAAQVTQEAALVVQECNILIRKASCGFRVLSSFNDEIIGPLDKNIDDNNIGFTLEIPWNDTENGIRIIVTTVGSYEKYISAYTSTEKKLFKTCKKCVCTIDDGGCNSLFSNCTCYANRCEQNCLGCQYSKLSRVIEKDKAYHQNLCHGLTEHQNNYSMRINKMLFRSSIPNL